MPARPPETILQSLITNRGKEAKLRRKLAANRECNWLLALVLHSLARLDAGATLTDLDSTFVRVFREKHFMDDEMRRQGRFYQQMPSEVRAQIFPPAFARLAPQTEYSLADLRQDAPDIVKAILSMRNVTDVNVEAIRAGSLHPAELPKVSRDVLRIHGTEILRMVQPNTLPPNPKYSIKATEFRCNDETGWDWLGSDEPYWVFGTVALGVMVTTKSQIFDGVDTGESRTFTSSDGWIWGRNAAPDDLPEGEIGSLISLFEHDYGDPKAIQDSVALAFALAASICTATGVAAWISAVIAGAGALVKWLLSFLDDDHIADQQFIFTRQALDNQLTKAGQSLDMSRRFTDGDGDYTLKIKVTRST